MPASQLQGEGNDRNRRDSGTRNLEVGKEGRLPSIEHATAGELAEMTSTLRQRACPPLPCPSPSKGEGGRRANLVRSGSQFVLPDLFGRVRLALNSSGSTVATAVFDSLGVQRHGSGTLASGVVRNTYGTGDEDGLAGILASRGWQWGIDRYCLRIALGAVVGNLGGKCGQPAGSCLWCLGIALGTCLLNPPLCSGALWGCQWVCGRPLLTCIAANLPSAVAQGVAVYGFCVKTREIEH